MFMIYLLKKSQTILQDFELTLTLFIRVLVPPLIKLKRYKGKIQPAREVVELVSCTTDKC